ncbi:beta-lactamase superfamily domain protein [bacterium BMS3Abin15]|nr:beta-lactamase superfamily domain protein [bacterium BMS3Abin15]
MKLCGPVENGKGAREMVEDLMRPPYFPVHCKEVRSHIDHKNFEFPKTLVTLIHPQGGYKFMNLDKYERLIRDEKFLPIGKGRYPVGECLVVTMYKSHHPEYTISYRFEEKTTGKVFVFLTDHENEAAASIEIKNHLKKVDLLVMDAQYSGKKYELRTAGFGHGTPGYCAELAKIVGAKILDLLTMTQDRQMMMF